MSLIMDKQEKVFDCSTIKRGDLKAHSIPVGKNRNPELYLQLRRRKSRYYISRLLRMLPIFSQSRQMML